MTIERFRETAFVLPEPPAGVHFIGVGGIGMSGLARILHARGFRVSGSDVAASDQTAGLAAEGIPVTIGHGDGTAAAAADLVVITAAVRGENPEVAAAVAAGVPVVKRAALLGALAASRRSVCVAGSHGKSTTSGMLVAALRDLGADPTYAIGAVLAATGTNAAPGAGAEFVVEADEYDYSFWQLTPDIAIVTNVDYDHPDLFPDQAAYDAAFAGFVARIKPGGAVILSRDDAGARRLMDRFASSFDGDPITFGTSGDSDWLLGGEPGAWRVRAPGGPWLDFPLAVPGEHNARNATAALAALARLGHDPVAAARALAGYAGIGRRFEPKGETGGVTVIDDYAHHPTEVAATLAAARDRFPGRRLWAVFQPHTFTRTKALLPEFAAALAPADELMVLDIYAARETDSLAVSSNDLLGLLPDRAIGGGGPADAAARLATEVRAGDVVLTMGAGDVTAVGPRLLEALKPSPVRAPGKARAATATIPDAPHLKLLTDSPMSLHTTWRVGGMADFLVRAPTPPDLAAALAWATGQGLPVTVIGGGSNLLVGDGGIRGAVILVRTPGERADGLVEATDLGDAVALRVGAAAPLSWVGRYAAERGWAGMDWGVGLPGTIGGATANNAGAHGIELKDYLDSVVMIDNGGAMAEYPAAWLDASYRHTRIKHGPRPRSGHIVAAMFRLPKGDPVELVRLADDHAAFRKRTQPTGACAGSVFANPPDDHAGRLLEAAGLKGFAIGAARFSPKHANWIVNEGGATAAQVRELIAHARQTVSERFGVALSTEVEELGER